MTDSKMENIKGSAMDVFPQNRVLVFVVALFLVITGWLYISGNMKVSSVKQLAADQQAAQVKQADLRQTETVKQSLNMFGIPLAWAVRREMMASNMAQLDQYVTELVKQKCFEQVIVAKMDGKIAVASDRKNLGAAFSTLYSADYLNADKITVEDKGAGKWLLAVPVMGLNGRLGTVAMDYQVPPAPAAQ